MACKIWLVLAALASLSGSAASGRPNQEPTIRLTVSVFNDAKVPQSVLQVAQARAETVLDGAGIALTWLDCGTPGNWVQDIGCRDIVFPSHLSVRLARNGRHRTGDVFGESFLDDKGLGNYASVYVEPLATSKALDVISEGDLLGYVVAHELGHLLLGLDSHSADGVMRAKWDFAALQQVAHGTLIFSANEAERMRARYLLASARQKAAERRTAAGK
jgi:hypothetical protein